ncbi:Lrp/AsnC family transcriptional regulator [Amycolatopsis minnesotensis]|uniref:Lrp/AsnC family transcriptional regulator n=1 Tax=Amycolatopsis minnesotensis TaxID=337894 RepID=A0ABN2Q0P2_9PSEU
MNFSTLVPLDGKILHALTLDGRVSFTRLGQVLGVSGQTIARRYSGLRTTAALRVLGTIDPNANGEAQWMLRVHTTPDAAETIATALARRPDTAWVQLTSAGTEIICASRIAEDPAGESPLLRSLPRTPRVLAVTAQRVLHTFVGGGHGLLDQAAFLTADERAALTPPPAEGEAVALTAADQPLLLALRRDGRAKLAELAAATGWSTTSAHRRLTALRDAGVLTFDVDFDRTVFGLRARTLLWTTVAAADLHRTGKALAAHPETVFAGATTGPTNLLVNVHCENAGALYTYLTERIASLPEIGTVETSPVLRNVKYLSGPY